MMNKDNFLAMLKNLNFKQDKTIWSKHFAHTDCELKVDFTQEKITYPENNGLTVNDRTTCNFSSSENAVVFECVHRLLEKGYKPEHIELEPKWKLGHEAKSGRADILVKDQQNTPLLIIECKTFGKEFDKAWKDTLTDGAQLFSYIEQEKATRFVCLYASEWDDKNHQLNTQQKIISVKDNAKILEENPKLTSFAKADNNKQRFKVWKDTYQQEFTETGIFEENILPYHIGKEKYTLEQDTKTIDAIDIKGAYHRFRTILRKHNVSRRENAFEVLVNLFLCKIVDEIENPNDLKFYWKGIAYDNYFDLVDRLQSLYKTGMEQFLNQDIVYISNDEIDSAFWAVKQKGNATKVRIKQIFRELKFYKGLDFEFIKVFNKAYFDKNAKILLEIIQMWQGLRLTSSGQNQFLGDMFEYFLDNGIKQSEGQFFTPVPICKFIVSSLPLEELIESHSEPIRAIDYACGSGHFLTEYAQQLPTLLKQVKNMDDAVPYYQKTYGIEKEDRLAKVAKVSAFMYGRKEIQIIDADALVPHSEIKEAGFNVLIANPPFAVEDFLLTVDEEHRDKYTLIDTVSDLGNKNIQCFFLERAQQLLAANGVMGVIVPSSVLSNSDSMHIATREILLKYFDFVSIAELGSNTFGKTGTNTVILFLRRKAQRPEPAEHYWNRVQDFFDNWADEVASAGGAYLDVDVVRQYCAHIGIDYTQYQTLLTGNASDELLATEMFRDYRADFDGLTEIKKLKDNKAFKAKTKAVQTAELLQRFNQYLKDIEQAKLYYFMLAHSNPCPVVLVKSPADNKAQKKFLGYEWSGAKGSEGVIYNGGDTVYDIQTPMFDPKERNNPSKISHIVRQNFLGQAVHIPTDLQPHVSQAKLTDLLDFSRKDFNKAFSLSVKKASVIESKWELVKLGELPDLVFQNGFAFKSETLIDQKTTETIEVIKIGNIQNEEISYGSNTQYHKLLGYENHLVSNGDLVIALTGATVGKAGWVKQKALLNQRVLALKSNEFNLRFVSIFLLSESFYEYAKSFSKGSAQGNLSPTQVKDFKIPLPPLNIQQEIVAACEKVDDAVRRAQSSFSQLNEQLTDVLLNQSFPAEKLASVALKVSVSIDPQLQTGFVNYIGLENIESQTGQLVGDISTDYQTIKSSKTCFIQDDILYGKLRPNLNKVYLAKQEGICSTDILVFRFKNKALAKFYAHYLKLDVFNKAVLATVSGQQLPRTSWGEMKDIKIPVPPLAEQIALVAQIEAIEAKITEAQRIIDDAPAQKQAILQRFL